VDLDEMPDPVLADDLGLLDIEGCGICIADGEVVRGIGGPPHPTPIVLGHEIVGRVRSVGGAAPEKIRDLVGRRVLVDDARPCGVCGYCQRGFPRSCRSPHYGHIGLEAERSWGGYASVLTLDERTNLVTIDENLALERASFAFALASGIEWLHLNAQLRSGESVAVVGHSRMGLASIASAALAGAGRIALYGGPEGEAAASAAKALGADLRGPEFDGEAFDVVAVVTETSAQEAALGLALAAPLGRVAMASCALDPIEVQPESVRKRGLTIRGGRGHTAPALAGSVAALTERPDLIPDDFFETTDLADVARALATMHDNGDRPFGRHRLVRIR
jgi:threonine dehydrogenase-like Zn-dependent dehydrogenase